MVVGVLGALVLVGSILGGSPAPTSRPSAVAVVTAAGEPATSSVPSGPASGPASSGSAPAPSSDSSSAPTVTPSPAAGSPGSGPVNLYAAAGIGMFSPSVSAFPERVYVPDEASGTVVVIDPRTFRILLRYPVGASPEHVTPDWDLQHLYVEAPFGNRLTIIDPKSGRVVGHHAIRGPYNLYFTLDGRMAIVILDSIRPGIEYGGHAQVTFYDRRTWHLIKALDVPWAGADHLDFSADGRFFLLSTEYAGRLVRIDVRKMAITGVLNVGGHPIDVRTSPNGRFFFVANQVRNGVSVIDAVHLREVAFLRTGAGAHGLALSRDVRWLYVSNRRAGTLSVIDVAKRKVIHTWRIGGSPDMIAVSPDGTQLWISNRFGGTVTVVNGQSGHVMKVIRVGGRPHGLAYFPEPGRVSLGHNGIYR
jgi:YVTN family beta-propeller protein